MNKIALLDALTGWKVNAFVWLMSESICIALLVMAHASETSYLDQKGKIATRAHIVRTSYAVSNVVFVVFTKVKI